MQEDSDKKQHNNLSIVSTLTTTHPNLKLKHMRPNIFDPFWFIKSHS